MTVKKRRDDESSPGQWKCGRMVNNKLSTDVYEEKIKERVTMWHYWSGIVFRVLLQALMTLIRFITSSAIFRIN